MLLKILLLIVVIFGIYYFFIKKKPNKNSKTKPNRDEEIMVECDKCKTYISDKEAIIKNGKYYCSKECANISKG